MLFSKNVRKSASKRNRFNLNVMDFGLDVGRRVIVNSATAIISLP